MNKLLLSLSLLIFSEAGFAASQTWDFTNSGNFSINGSSFGNELHYNDNNGIDLAASAWADTNEVTTNTWGTCRFFMWTYPCITSSSTTEYVEQAKIDANSYGLLTYNKDETSYEHTVDNLWDYDMILLSFSQAVNISEVSLGWASPDGDITLAAFDSLPTLVGETWQSIAAVASNAWSFAGTAGSQTIDVSTKTSGIESQFWLVGAYNNSFDYLKDCVTDAIKIAGITTSSSGGTSGKPTPVPEPASILIFLTGIAFLINRKKLLG